jgi:hypothetical protein
MLEQISIHNWIIKNGIKTETGKPLDFHIHRYLYDIYRDNSQFLCCIKAGQIGFSTMAILKTIWLARNKRIDIGYILPTVEMVQKFVGSKVNRMAQQNPVINSWFKEKDSISQKQIDENYIFYLGAQTDRSAIMLSLDMLVADEYDKAPQDILEIYDSRLQHSKHGIKWVFSNPTIPNFGVDRFWELSDKKIWHIKHSCGAIYPLDESCIDYVDEVYKCPSCKKEITDEQRRMGEWVATADGKWSGYWIPLWLSPDISAATIAEKKNRNTSEYFANFVAGTAYINVNNMLSQQVLESNLTEEVNSQEGRIIIGVDTGHNIHYTLANKEGMFYHGYCPSVEENEKGERLPNYNPWNEIERLLIKYPRSIAIIDQGGDLIGPRILQAKYRGRVFLCWSTKEKRTQQIITWGENDEDGKVQADRNRLVQLFVDELKDQRAVFNGSAEDWQPWFNHALNIYRVKEIQGEDENDPQYGWRYVWKRKGPDHWFFSGLYARIGVDRFSQDLAQVIHAGPRLGGIEKSTPGITSEPYQPYLSGIEVDI